MAGPCFDGGGIAEECLLNNELNRGTERHLELLRLKIRRSLVSICEYDPQNSKVRISMYSRDDGEQYSESIIPNISRDDALKYFNHSF